MTPAVTAIALMRFARVEMSTSARIGNTTKEKADAGGNVLNCINEWPIDFHFDRGRAFYSSGCSHHCHGSGGGGFRSIFVDGNECLVKYLRDVEIIVRLPRRHPVKVGASSRLIECRLHPKSLEFFR